LKKLVYEKKRYRSICFLQSARFDCNSFLRTGAACSVLSATLLAFFHQEASSKFSQRTLSFSERVAYQRAIEDVYWRHRIWPNERGDPKPSLGSVMSQAQLEKKVAAYLRDSEMLQRFRNGPITADQLQAEMDRMASHTKDPDVLREIFQALGNNAFVIAECLARPVLAEDLLRKIHDDCSEMIVWGGGADGSTI
jgi:hypothetical protein